MLTGPLTTSHSLRPLRRPLPTPIASRSLSPSFSVIRRIAADVQDAAGKSFSMRFVMMNRPLTKIACQLQDPLNHKIEQQSLRATI